MRKLAFRQVDVFTSVPFRGNPVAVVLDAAGLDTAQMQRIANWTNLSETTFVVPKTAAEADYQVRIFTPGSELPFAGHPTIGTAHALLEAGLVTAHEGRLVQECGTGLVRLEVGSDASPGRSISFELPAPRISPLTDAQAAELGSILGTTLASATRPRLVDVGPRWVVAQLPDAAAVLAAMPDLERMKAHDLALGATGVVIFGAQEPGTQSAVEVRAFAPSCGVNEDPVCGSGNGCMAAFVRDTGQVGRFGSSFVASQGRLVGRDGLVRIAVEPDRIRVGGAAVTCIEGTITMPD
ncbi:MAG: PhzF family phenazine biosynthesis protein [Burkholderiaceae bacterium]|nr:PhzF family phenazine biosynthesis protein [Burkholderiaceae bacterium]MEB2318691.1 PhzF family phenazine biosynthesis protein [Pseudomonadota bacterium]